MSNEYIITVDNVYAIISEHMNRLDELWPDSLSAGHLDTPRKVHIVELIDAIKLRLIQQAEKNASRYESPFEKAAKKITGYKEPVPKKEDPLPTGKTAMQLAHEAAQSRMRGRSPS